MTVPQPIELPPEAPEALAQPAPPAASSALALLLRDRALQILLVLTLIANLALFGYLALRFDALPDALPMHFDAAGLPDRIESKTGIFGLPLIGLVLLLLNTALGILIHRRERAAAILLVASVLLVQVLMWFATINIGGLF
jgi:hypothetical protein